MKAYPIIQAVNLQKNYGKRRALKGISFSVYEEEILCFLGPNGAGKSTAISLISTALEADGGEIFFLGSPVSGQKNNYKRSLGISPQDLAIYEEISAYANVRFFGALYGLKGKELKKKVDEALAFVGLTDRKHDKPKTFSGGMKRRLNMACALVHQPKVLILDEPTVGIDPQSRNHILASIKLLKDQGTTIIYTTHYMEEVEEISTRIIILDQGEIIAEGTKEELKAEMEGEKFYEIQVENPDKIQLLELNEIEGVKTAVLEGALIQITTKDNREKLAQIISLLVAQGVRISNVATLTPNLETVFLNLTGRKLRD